MAQIGVVLAGGRSTRMGRDKALLSWRGRPLIEHQMALLKRAGVAAVVVSGARPAYDGIQDDWAGLGPVAGLATIARHRPGHHELIVVPVDMPLLQVATLANLLRLQPALDCLRPAGVVLPMRLRLNARTRAALSEIVARRPDSGRSLRALQAMLDCGELPFADSDRAQFADCNTLVEWESCHEGTETGSEIASASQSRGI